MIFKRFGASYQSVDPSFDAKAMTEIAFRRNRHESFPTEELETRYEPIETREVATHAEGDVQTETEQLMLDRLETVINDWIAELPAGAVLVVENEAGHDYPKPRQEIKNVIVEGENKLYFHYTMAPPARITAYRAKT